MTKNKLNKIRKINDYNARWLEKQVKRLINSYPVKSERAALRKDANL
jgi:hypothetical protein